jgi:thiol-disulfide isomerase/thioredoxin
MKKIIYTILISLGLINCSEAQKTNFTSESLQEMFLASSGELITLDKILDQYQDKTVVIDVWASWCPDCVKGMSKVKQLQKKHTDVVFLFLSYDKTPEKWKAGIEKYKVKGEHYLIQSAWKGGKFSESIDLDWIPRYMVVINKKIVLYKAIEADDEKLINALK